MSEQTAGRPDDTCGRCGARRPADPDSTLSALAWSAQHERGTVRWLCPDCARKHVRDIEAKLPDEFW
ncbi:hypothetical protein [Amycolatopsis suaedae]|uniref:Uncharacterized protein n=1 Tax=Amycolatopsis suaedae TaxID=2510978 RepID=A0A4Q7IYZ7_9PSEU|nr:hypothetical protein [Amycolatopsis suaedae]RZQ59283.1 hypothetical protein EWH70_34980 [Amycolatopsis suaedae]